MKTLLLRQVSRQLEVFAPLRNAQRPLAGWIKTIRTALGMSTAQLAKRLDVSPQRVSDIEKAEVHGNMTVQTLDNVAEALGCEFVYAFVPKRALEITIDNQAKRMAEKRLDYVSHSMGLENQATSIEEKQLQLQELINELKMSKTLWDDK